MEKANKLFKKFPYIYAYGRLLGSLDHYIEMQCSLAMQAEAPFTSIRYDSSNEKWITVTDVPHLKEELESLKYPF